MRFFAPANMVRGWCIPGPPGHPGFEPVCLQVAPVLSGYLAPRRLLDSKIANGLIEAINSLIQAAKAKARGYRSLRNFIVRDIRPCTRRDILDRLTL
jgi:hypothetical protein